MFLSNLKNYNTLLKPRNFDQDFLHEYIENFIAIKSGTGLYSHFGFGIKLKELVEKIIDQNLSDLGYEVLLTPIEQAEIYKQSGRDQVFGDTVFHVFKNNKHTYTLSPTAEETAVTSFLPDKISYKRLPYMIYQKNLKFRNEIRPRNTIVRSNAFYMKDAYSFCQNIDQLDSLYKKIRERYIRIFDTIELNYVIEEADCSAMCGYFSEEFIAESITNEAESTTKPGFTGMEIGHIFNLGDYFTKKFNKSFINENDQLEHPLMGCYGIGISRVVYLICEQILNKKFNSRLLYQNIFIPRSEEEADLIRLYHENSDYSLFDDNYDQNFANRLNTAYYYGVRYAIFFKKFKLVIYDIRKDKTYNYEGNEDMIKLLM